LPGQTLWAVRYGVKGLVKNMECAASEFGMLCKHALPLLMNMCRPAAVVCLLGADMECSWRDVGVDHEIVVEHVMDAWDRSGVRPPPRLEWKDVRRASYVANHPPKLTLMSRDFSTLSITPAWMTDSGVVDRASVLVRDGRLDADSWEACSARQHTRVLRMQINDPDVTCEDLVRILEATPKLTDLKIVVDACERNCEEAVPAAARALETVRIPGLKRLAWNVNIDQMQWFESSWSFAVPDWVADQIEVLSLSGNALIDSALVQNVSSCRRLHTLKLKPGDTDCSWEPWNDLLEEVAHGRAAKTLRILIIGSSDDRTDGGYVLEDMLEWWEQNTDAFPALEFIGAQGALDAWHQSHEDGTGYPQDDEEATALDRRLYAFLRNKRHGVRLW
jgi:hypothetical protein